MAGLRAWASSGGVLDADWRPSSCAGYAGRADLPELAARAVGLALDAGVVGELLDQVDELDAAVLGHGAFEHGAEGGDVGLGLGDAEPLEDAAGRGVDGDRVAAEGLLDHGGRDVVGRERLVLLEDLERSLSGFLVSASRVKP